MAPPTNGGDGLFLLLFLLCLSTPRGSSSNSITASLSALQSSSSSGVIRLNDTLLRRIHSLPSPRPFHLVVFFDAKKLHSRSELALPTLKSEFSLVSSSFLANNPDNKSRSLLFFFDVEVEESQATFALFDVNTLPHIRLVPSAAADLKSDSIKLDAAHFSSLVDAMGELIESETGISVGPINRPPVVSRTQMILVMVGAVIWAPYAVRKLASGKSMVHEKSTWMAGAVFVYFFSVSGTMFNIIRKAPMFIVDRRDGETVMLFYQGAGVQLGAEGFIVGFLYTVVGLLLAFVCHVLVRVRDTKWQRISMILALLLSWWAVRQLIYLNNWKTGYRSHAYWWRSASH
ncbi:probable dolichyl-diphosphooligosaccharide--protein glycosyltransferase subunit 3 [Salvia miltiorrhiza]|uniref:probable dolichyl-diphosphooligosaccharide--protein glycosyltransferase subunit 3 n=1 Tax=Salvia miltiorrhiza TaxID=226208 RepID=UPI0025AC8757|nr:probable dolichyl-diphosphooligosaccharide--protein glycosyltransferase subunit 3 [Salvia miltiorrhiza]